MKAHLLWPSNPTPGNLSYRETGTQATHCSSACDGHICRQPQGSTAKDRCLSRPGALGAVLRGKVWLTVPAWLMPRSSSAHLLLHAIHRPPSPLEACWGCWRVGPGRPGGGGDLCLSAGECCSVPSASIGSMAPDVSLPTRSPSPFHPGVLQMLRDY